MIGALLILGGLLMMCAPLRHSLFRPSEWSGAAGMREAFLPPDPHEPAPDLDALIDRIDRSER